MKVLPGSAIILSKPSIYNVKKYIITLNSFETLIILTCIFLPTHRIQDSNIFLCQITHSLLNLQYNPNQRYHKMPLHLQPSDHDLHPHI